VYIPTHFAADDAALVRLLAHPSAADLVTATADGLLATPLPLLFEPHTGSHGALLGHLARNNDQWRRPPIGEAMVIVRGPQAYVSPGFYPSKAEHGRVVPTWNYVTAHVHGRLVIHDDPAWVEANVRRLTATHERDRAAPWLVDDAPEAYLTGQYRAIVGVEIVIDRIEAKFKLSQNRSVEDVDGAIAGLEDGPSTGRALAAAMDVARGRR
jgi:transcriptional regulator